ncbi:MAG: glycosyltransferase [Caldilineaceae bacterium]
MKKVLMIAHAFPPIGGIGALRAVKFAKYLPDFGWQPVILTVAQSDSFMKDASLLDELPPGTPIYRAHSWEPINAARVKQTTERLGGSTSTGQSGVKQQLLARLKPLYFALRIPDDKVGWLPFGTRLGRQVLQQEAIDLIWATAPPYTALLIGAGLKRAGGKPLITDYRDEWSSMQYQDYPTNPVTTFLNAQLERRVLRQSDYLVTANPGMADNLRRAHLLTAATPHIDIMNGFDDADYVHNGALTHDGRFTIVYTGTLYGERRSPKYFLHGLAQLLDVMPTARPQLRVCFVGTHYEQHVRLVEELKLTDVVEFVGMVPHQMATQYQLMADLLLLIVGNGPGSQVVFTGKLFEYLGARRPILALAPLDGPAAKLIAETVTGYTVDSEDSAEIGQTLQQLYTAWQEQRFAYTPHTALVNQYSRRAAAEKLAAIFDQVAETATTRATGMAAGIATSQPPVAESVEGRHS